MKILTHDGIFHADEVVAIALLMVFHNRSRESVTIMRTRDQETIREALSTKEVIVIDVGERYDSSMNFDHHQNPELPCAATLVWIELIKTVQESAERQRWVYLNDMLISFVNKWDRDLDGSLRKKYKAFEFSADVNCLNFSQCIKLMNVPDYKTNMGRQTQMFETALEFAIQMIKCFLNRYDNEMKNQNQITI